MAKSSIQINIFASALLILLILTIKFWFSPLWANLHRTNEDPEVENLISIAKKVFPENTCGVLDSMLLFKWGKDMNVTLTLEDNEKYHAIGKQFATKKKNGSEITYSILKTDKTIACFYKPQGYRYKCVFSYSAQDEKLPDNIQNEFEEIILKYSEALSSIR